jgi:ABC-type multidrug transport system permease subunit
MAIEAKIFFTCLIFLVATTAFCGATRHENLPDLVDMAAVVLFFLSALGMIVSVLFAIWR